MFRYNRCNLFILSMVNQALFDVVKNQLASGVGENEIKEFLQRRGTSEAEAQELFEALNLQSVTIRDIPVAEPTPVAIPEIIAPVVEAPAVVPQSEAHGIVREIPPIQPSAPFTPISPEQAVAMQQAALTNTNGPVPSAVVFEDEDAATPNKKKPFIIAGAGIVAVIVLLVGGYFVYSSYFASPETVMDTMISRLRDVRSGEFSLDVTAVTSSMNELAATSTTANPFLSAFAIQGPVTIALHASGTVDVRDEQKPTFSIGLTSTMDKWSMGNFVLGLEYRNVDKVNYLKINDVPDLGFLSLSFLKNHWFKVGDSEAKAQLGGTSSTTSSGGIVPTVSQDQRDRLVEAWKTYRFLTVIEVMNSEDIDGVSTHHYKLAFDKEVFKKWNAETSTILDKSNVPSDTTALDADLNLTTINDLELWIGKRDGLPHKFIAKVSLKDKIDPNKTSDVAIAMGGNKFNSALDVTAPEGAKSVEEALQGIFGQMLKESPAAPATTPQKRNVQREANINALMSAMRLNMADHNGVFDCPPAGPLPTKATFIGKKGYNIEQCLVPLSMSSMPKDPAKGTADMIGYSIFYNPTTKKTTIRAPYAELGKKISVTK